MIPWFHTDHRKLLHPGYPKSCNFQNSWSATAHTNFLQIWNYRMVEKLTYPYLLTTWICMCPQCAVVYRHTSYATVRFPTVQCKPYFVQIGIEYIVYVSIVGIMCIYCMCACMYICTHTGLLSIIKSIENNNAL
jgi:hypothetical protein